jgi:hypothetical protein
VTRTGLGEQVSGFLRHAAAARRGRRRAESAPAAASELPVCVVYGNCQAVALRLLLEASPRFTEAYRTVHVPPVHEITEGSLPGVEAAIGCASLFVTHPIRDGYHGFPIGSEQIAGFARERCRLVTVPPLYYDGLYPFQVYVRDERGIPIAAPRSTYHDVRFLHCAAKRWDVARAAAWLADWRPDPDGVRTLAAYCKQRLLGVEAPLDVHVVERLTAPDLHSRAFFTINHPSNAALAEVAAGVHRVLELPYEQPVTVVEELLGQCVTPLEAPVIDALDLVAEPRHDWIIDGSSLTPSELLSIHIDWYREHPGIVAAGLEQHQRRSTILGLS